MNNIYMVFIGEPGVGKSQAVKKIAAILKEHGWNVEVKLNQHQIITQLPPDVAK